MLNAWNQFKIEIVFREAQSVYCFYLLEVWPQCHIEKQQVKKQKFWERICPSLVTWPAQEASLKLQSQIKSIIDRKVEINMLLTETHQKDGCWLR